MGHSTVSSFEYCSQNRGIQRVFRNEGSPRWFEPWQSLPATAGLPVARRSGPIIAMRRDHDISCLATSVEQRVVQQPITPLALSAHSSGQELAPSSISALPYGIGCTRPNRLARPQSNVIFRRRRKPDKDPRQRSLPT